MNRRRFFVTTAVAAGGFRALGANDRVNIAVVGARGRGRDHIVSFSTVPGARIAAVCDTDQAQVERASKLAESRHGAAPAGYRDIRKLLESRDIDAISIATPNHWHALATIWACQAGKDVYVEKPACHNIFEGRRMVEAARKYNRMVQVGMQSRSNTHKVEAIRLLREGIIGKLYMAKGICYKRRLSIGRTPDGPVPPGVDYDTWLGPARRRPFNPNRFHYNWHWFWEYGNGDIGNQGVHEMDIARWGLGKDTLPERVISTGGKYIYDDDQETPNTQSATFEYPDCQLVFEVRGLITGGEASISLDSGYWIGNIFFGSEGYMSLDPNGCRIYKGEKRELEREFQAREEIWATAPLMANWLEAIRARDHRRLACDVREGHLSTALVHMANTSYRLGRKLRFDPARENYPGDAEAGRYLTRDYRAPFVVPDNV